MACRTFIGSATHSFQTTAMKLHLLLCQAHFIPLIAQCSAGRQKPYDEQRTDAASGYKADNRIPDKPSLLPT